MRWRSAKAALGRGHTRPRSRCRRRASARRRPPPAAPAPWSRSRRCGRCPANAATGIPAACARSTSQAGGVPSADAKSFTSCAKATSMERTRNLPRSRCRCRRRACNRSKAPRNSPSGHRSRSLPRCDCGRDVRLNVEPSRAGRRNGDRGDTGNLPNDQQRPTGASGAGAGEPDLPADRIPLLAGG